jgi:hypothetical protein
MLILDLNTLLAYDIFLHRLHSLFMDPSTVLDALCDPSGSDKISVHTSVFLIRFSTPWAIRWNGWHD